MTNADPMTKQKREVPDDSRHYQTSTLVNGTEMVPNAEFSTKSDMTSNDLKVNGFKKDKYLF